MATAKRRHETLEGDLGEDDDSEAEEDEESDESPGKRVKLEHELLQQTALAQPGLDL